MKNIFIYCTFIFMIASSCTSDTNVSTDDTDPPVVGILGASGGNILSINSLALDTIENMFVIPSRKGAEAAFLASVSDSRGVKSLKVEVAGSGKIIVKGDEYTQYIQENTNEGGVSKDGIVVGGNIKFGEGKSAVTIIVSGTDWAGNEVVLPRTVFRQYDLPTASLEASKSVIYRSEEVTLTYEFTGSTGTLNGEALATKSGEIKVKPEYNTFYKLITTNPVGVDSVREIVYVVEDTRPKIIDFTLGSVPTIGEPFELSWETKNAYQITLGLKNQTPSNVAASGSQTFTLNNAGSYEYVLTASKGIESDTKGIVVTIDEENNNDQNCHNTNCQISGLYCFVKDQDMSGTIFTHWYLNHSVWQGSPKKITTITNNLDRLIDLTVVDFNNAKTVTLEPGEQTSEFQGFSQQCIYEVVTIGNPSWNIGLEICFE